MTYNLAIIQGETIPTVDSTLELLANITKEDALAAVRKLSQQESEDWFRVGMVLSSYRANKTEKEWDDLLIYANENFKVNKRKAYYLIDIYESLTKSGISFDQVKSVGWTKLKEFAHKLTPENVDYWVATATENSTKNLITLLKSPLTSNASMSSVVDDHLDSTTKADTPLEDIPHVVKEPSPTVHNVIIPTSFNALDENPLEVVYGGFVGVDGGYTKEEFTGEAYTPLTLTLPEGDGIVFDDPTPSAPESIEPPVSSELKKANPSLVAKLKPYALDTVLKTITEVFPHLHVTQQEASCNA